MEHTDLSRNTLSFLGLAAEYCSALENALHTDKEEFTTLMLKLLPRLYITLSDTDPAMLEEQNEPLATYLEPEQYDSIRHGVAVLMGEDDTYLETFEQDMKYSDTPIAATISESLADIYQPLLNCALAVRDAGAELAAQAVAECRESFNEYWAQTLCNVLRPLNALHYNI